ncbi:MAG: DUF742 domain-containing protein [Pseudonocardiaceae bacterium]
MSEPGGSKHHEQSSADVLNRLSGGPRRSEPAHDRSKSIEEPPVEQRTIPWLASSRPAIGSDSLSAQWPVESQWPVEYQDWGELPNFVPGMRSYSWIRGRTRPVHNLAVEALVSTRIRASALVELTSIEHRSVAELCGAPRSVAEVAALLNLPLGVVRVLLGDMADLGLVVVHRTATHSGDAPGFSFLERVLSGLRRL